MIWFFTQGDRRLKYEIRLQDDDRGFEMITTYPDGFESVEIVTSPAELLARSVEALKRLREEGWLTLEPPQAAV
ncbi:MAG: hypothetical protein LC804_12220 [Acidobacteria bacterium]|nr:hypothetical protein [Acidobacteriota bacterium]